MVKYSKSEKKYRRRLYRRQIRRQRYGESEWQDKTEYRKKLKLGYKKIKYSPFTR